MKNHISVYGAIVPNVISDDQLSHIHDRLPAIESSIISSISLLQNDNADFSHELHSIPKDSHSHFQTIHKTIVHGIIDISTRIRYHQLRFNYFHQNRMSSETFRCMLPHSHPTHQLH